MSPRGRASVPDLCDFVVMASPDLSCALPNELGLPCGQSHYAAQQMSAADVGTQVTAPSPGRSLGSESREHRNKPRILMTIPARLETPILSIAVRRKALTVFVLMPMFSAISLLLSPCSSSITTCCSRWVSWNCWETWDRARVLETPRSKSRRVPAPLPLSLRGNARQR